MRQVSSVLGDFVVWEADHLGQVLESGAFWDAQLKPFLDAGDPAGWAIDVGASIGFLTRYLASRYQQVLAVEALGRTFDMLKLNCNGRSHVRLLHGVAYDRECCFELAPADALGWPTGDLYSCPNVSSLAFTPAWNGQFKGIVLDREIPDDARVTLIKVDAQGCDLRALRGLRQTIRRCRPLILFEFEEAASSWHGDTWDDYEQFFARERYTITRIREDLWDFVSRPL